MLEKPNHPDSPTLQAAPVRPANDVTHEDVPERPSQDHASSSVTVIAADMVFNGDLVAGDTVQIHGSVEGTIGRDIKSVVVGKHGRVKAMIYAARVTIEGRVEGDIHGDKIVELKAGAVVLGNVFCPSIQVDKGANFNGTVTMV